MYYMFRFVKLNAKLHLNDPVFVWTYEKTKYEKNERKKYFQDNECLLASKLTNWIDKIRRRLDWAYESCSLFHAHTPTPSLTKQIKLHGHSDIDCF